MEISLRVTLCGIALAGGAFGRDMDIEDPAAVSGCGADSEPSFDRRRWFAARQTGSGQFYPDPTRAGSQSELACRRLLIGFWL